MEQHYVFCLFECELHEGTDLIGIYTDQYQADKALKEKSCKSNPKVFQYFIDRVELNTEYTR